MSLQKTAAKTLPLMTLRVGLVFEGQITAERLAQPGKPITIGSGRCDLIVPEMPRRSVLFEPRGHGFVLLARPGMTGRVALDSGVFELSGAPSQARGDVRAVTLDEHSRGKVEIGAWTVLFQFVSTPLVAARPATDFRPPLLGETDHTFVGFLATFSAAAIALLSVAASTPIPDEVDISMAPERVIQQILLNTVPLPKPVVEEVAAAAPQPTDRASRRAARQDDRELRQAQRAADRRTVADRLASSPLMAGLLGTHGASGRDDMFTGSDTIGEQVRDALGHVSGEDQASLGSMNLHAGPGGRGEDAYIGELGRGGGGTSHLGGPTSGRAPSARADKGFSLPPSAAGASEEGIRQKVREYSGAVQVCYEQSLRSEPDLNGRVVLSLSLASGRVSEAVIVENSTGSQDLALCVEQRAARWKFDTSVTLDFLVPFALSKG